MLYQVFLIVLIEFRPDLGFQNFNYDQINLVKNLIKVYLASLGTLTVIMPLIAIFRNLALVIFLSLILTMIPSEYNPLILYSNNYENWVYGIVLLIILFPLTICLYLPLKIKNAF
jgi:hypothetical protein